MSQESDDTNQSISGLKDIFKVSYDGKTIKDRSEEFFSNIQGLESLKNIFYRALISKKQINMLLLGDDEHLKSKFILHIKEQCNDVFYFDASKTHGSKLIGELYSNRLSQVIIIDNIDELRKNYLDSLGGFLGEGRIAQFQKTKSKDFMMQNIKVFATAENLKKFSSRLKTRFLIYKIPT
ncbi:MAG: hypothetical protein L0H53_03970 [Candidatus Nitrosocosmicus sp.]|nr:hypothetical protein [Candidatus Nitrosocosmicus sp.]MDN5868130.1 hypothetical protein [Candidatus Nitrosocosmicus sp.]